MSKIYTLVHIHKFKCNHEDTKLLGSFSSYHEALKKIGYYKNLPGFKETPHSFVIKTYNIDKFDKKALQKLMQKTFLSRKNVIYLLYHIMHPEDKLIAIFSSRKHAYQALLENSKNSSLFENELQNFYLEEEEMQ